jgi:CRISPR-associated exonuclease Cas4
MSTADDLSLPLSALQHYAFCPRQCALIHIERQWAENTLTSEGRVLHDKAHEPGRESRRDVRVTRSLRLQSTALGLHGVADIVEFHREAGAADVWRPFPVEYKRGRPKREPIDEVQLCAQALCLEEMFSAAVPCGVIFYGAVHRREDVAFDDALRAETRRIAAELRAMVVPGKTPAPQYAPKCRSCSLLDLCKPRAVTRSASAYLERLFSS